jgi:non-specific serine/threonine protein kinase
MTLHLQHSTTSSLLDIAATLVSPKSFLFGSHRTTTPPPLSSQRLPTMDKSQQPSSFQQLEKVSFASLSGLALYYEFNLTACLDF